MRQDSAEFQASNKAQSKHPRLVVRHIFDVASIYVTSDASMVNVPGTALLGHLQGVSAVSQEINPDDARSTIGSLSYSVVDVDSDLTDALRNQLQVEFQNLRGRTVELRLGYTNDYDDTQVLFTQQVKGCSFDDGSYQITCNDIQRETRKDILEPLVTTLRLSVDEDDTTLPVQDTTGFQAVFHGPSYTDAPSSTVGYVKIEDEIIRYTGTTSDSFTGCTRGVFNTVPAAHEVETGASDDRQPEVTEFIYLELPGPKLAYALLTGVLSGDSASLPSHWHLGVDTSKVALAQFQAIGRDLWDTTDDDATLVLRFSGLEKTDGKRFLEEQVYQPLGLYSPVLNDGTLGLRRMNQILADAPHVMVLNEDSFVQVGSLVHDFDSLLNVFSIDWNYDPIAERFTRRRKVIDQSSIDIHGEADTKELEWQGIHGSRHTDAVLLQRCDSIRDRYAGPPLRLTGNLLHSYNVLEVGDVVRVQLPHVRDYTGPSGPIDRSFEVQRIAVDQVSGQVSVSLFGSSQRSSVLPPGTGTALPDAWYASEGTELSTVCTIVADVIQAGTYDLTGDPDLNDGAAIYYYLGDLELADGAVLTVNDNVQLRIRGFFTINGDIDGSGRGLAGATDDSNIANANPGTAGFIGSTRGWEGLNSVGSLFSLALIRRWAAPQATGLYTSFPFLELSVVSDALVGLPTDLRGTSGGIGGRIVDNASSVIVDGGDGGDGGAGLAIICRGAAFGASGSIDVSGGDGVVGGTTGLTDETYQAGTGAPGAPGGVLCVIDGSAPSLPDILSNLTAAYGSVPSAGTQPTGEIGDGLIGWRDKTEPLAGYNTSISGDITASVLRIQRLAPEQSPTEDVAVLAPANLAVDTTGDGFSHVLTNTQPPAGFITEYFGSDTNDRGDAVLLGSSTAGRFVSTPEPSTATYYWARNREISTNRVSVFTPNTSTSTIIGASIPAIGAGADGNSSIVASVYRRAASPPSTPTTDDGSYNFTTRTLTPPSGWSATPPASDGNPLYVSVGIFEVSGTAGTDETVTWSTTALLVQDGATGATGDTGATGPSGNSSIVASVYRRAASPPSTPTTDDGSYSFTTRTLTPPSGWSATPPASDGNPLYVSTGIFEIAGTTGTDETVTWSAPAVLVTDGADGADGDEGSAGSPGTSSIVASVYQRASSAPSTPTADDGSYNFTTRTLTPPSGWSATPPAVNGNPLYVSVGIFEITGTTGTDETVTWTAPAVLVTDGVSPIGTSLTNPSPVVASLFDGTGYSLTSAGGTHQVFEGATDITTSATHSIVGGTDGGANWTKAQNGLTLTVVEATGVYSFSGASWTSDSETFTVRATYNSVNYDKTLTITKAKAAAGPPIHLQAANVSDVTLTPTNAVAQFRLLNTGVAQRQTVSAGTASLFTWLLAGSASDYECRFIGTGDTGAMTLGNLNTWENLGTTRTWAITDTSSAGSPLSVTGPLQIGFAGENTALFSATLTITAEESG